MSKMAVNLNAYMFIITKKLYATLLPLSSRWLTTLQSNYLRIIVSTTMKSTRKLYCRLEKKFNKNQNNYKLNVIHVVPLVNKQDNFLFGV